MDSLFFTALNTSHSSLNWMQLPAKFLNHQYWSGGGGVASLSPAALCFMQILPLSQQGDSYGPPNVKQARHASGFSSFLILKPEACWDVQKLLSSLPLPTSQMVRDGELCSCKPEPQTRFSAAAKKAKLCFFWLVTQPLSPRSTRLWHLDMR